MSSEKFENGINFVNIKSAVSDRELRKLNNINSDYINYNCIKFVPASGAATRMFKDLYSYLENQEKTEFVETFLSNLENFAFYDDLQDTVNSVDFSMGDKEENYLINNIVKDGLSYGSLPKALIKIHDYGNVTTTPIDEHIYEGEQYLNDERIQLHFTIANDHEELFNTYIEEAIKDKSNVEVTYSFQKPETNTMAVDMENAPFVLNNGEVLYRPGGHGALLENLNDLDGDIIFIKNVDNVCHRSRIEDTLSSKKALASIGLEVKKQVDQYLMQLKTDEYNLEEIVQFLNETLNVTLKSEWTKEKAIQFLDRPLRVCGVVENAGEPGGGPFIVDNGEYLDLQICEKSEIDLSDPAKVEILNNSQYFNPVDLVCFVKDYEDNKYDLTKYVNEDRYFISEKSHNGRKLKALEHPGLWNGAMHHWNTLFVEVPSSTFNPIKTVNDLLRDGHQESVLV
ncbi:DUF4301 family protein [Marinilactibacillus piezotolerans]|uniref:DUF4301 family protein n=1 Tax=Marinilactibacillus piezotolerans TaxID=258723 RepID=UPI0009AF68DF|nr:DUF4301 family protein [Marinilactibacillus piezotolerans]